MFYKKTFGCTDLQNMINGKIAKEGMFPFMAAVSWVAGTTRSECSGFIISPQAILAAAHCLHIGNQMNVLAANYTAQLGRVTKSRGILIPLKAILHPDYDKQTHNNDVSIMKPLRGRFPMSRYVRTIPLENQYVKPRSAFAMGWGKTVPETCVASRGWPSKRLRYHSQNVLEVQQMKIKVRGKDSKTCMGDSGSPLVETRRGKYVAFGILSAGTKIGNEYYTRISNQKKFIRKHAPEAKWH